MTRNLVRCSVIGGLIVFIWGVLSWMALPMHKNSFKKFKNESEVADVIRDNVCEDGMYILPNTMRYCEDSCNKEMRRGLKMLDTGPFMFASVHKDGLGRMCLWPFIGSIITQIIGAFIVTWMLMQTKIHSFNHKVGFVTLFGLGVGILSQIPDWTWWGFSGCYVFINLLDFVIGWFLAGLAIAKFSTSK